MIFKDILIEKTQALQPEFDKLFLNILAKQTHIGDLLLIQLNGFYNPEVYTWSNSENKNPYMIGPNTEGHSDFLHYKFIHDYRQKSISPWTYAEYLEKTKWSDEKAKEIFALTEAEGMSIQLEMLIYIKIWEADLFIKKLYQLTTLSQGEPYDWHFKITESNRDKKTSTGKREEIIRKKIRDRLEIGYPKIYSAIKSAYKTQIRNAIGHSTYSFAGRFIHPNNYIENDTSAQIQVLSFDEWIEMFHDTMIIYNQLIRFSQMIDDFYTKAAEQNNLLFEIRVNRQDPTIKTEYTIVKYNQERKDWDFNRK